MPSGILREGLAMKLKSAKPSLMSAHPWDSLLSSNGEATATLGRDSQGHPLLMIEGRAFTPRQLKGMRWNVVRATPGEMERLGRSAYASSFHLLEREGRGNGSAETSDETPPQSDERSEPGGLERLSQSVHVPSSLLPEHEDHESGSSVDSDQSLSQHDDPSPGGEEIKEARSVDTNQQILTVIRGKLDTKNDVIREQQRQIFGLMCKLEGLESRAESLANVEVDNSDLFEAIKTLA
jgi:hypothetical protein